MIAFIVSLLLVRGYVDPEVASALEQIVAGNHSVMVQGYRIRIYFDNSQNSRTESEAVMASFKASHPEIPAFRTFESPCFKVTVGNYRTRSEALAALDGIKRQFPSAFIVKEKIRYPQMPGDVAAVLDSIAALPVLPPEEISL